MASVQQRIHPSEWLELPRRTGVLLARYWPALFCIFFVQRLAGWALLPFAVKAGYVNHLLGILGLSFIVVVQLLCTIAMFDAVRDGMNPPFAWRSDLHQEPGRPARFGRMLGVVLLPFLAYYVTWGLLADNVRAYVLEYLRGSLDQQNGMALDLLNAKGVVLSVVLTWILRRLLLGWHKRRPSAVLSILATTCQAYWVFIGLMVLTGWKNSAWDWVEHRVAWHWWLAVIGSPADAANAGVVAGPDLYAQAYAFIIGAFKTMLLPLAWFAIAAVVYGRNLKDTESLFSVDTRLQRVRQHYAKMLLPIRFAVDQVISKASSGWNSKGVPIVNSVRMLNDGGLQLVLALCFYYVALGVVCEFAWRFVAELIGPRDIFQWELLGRPLTVLFGSPMQLEPSLLGEPLRICLLAAAVGMAMQRADVDPPPVAVSGAGSEGSGVAAQAG